MKAVRGLLAVNLDMAQARLVSKSDVENEAYLFRAALQRAQRRGAPQPPRRRRLDAPAAHDAAARGRHSSPRASIRSC